MNRITSLAILALAVSCRDARTPTPPTGTVGPATVRGDARPSELESYIVELRRDAGSPRAFATSHGVSPKFVYLRALNGFAAALSASAAAQLANEPAVARVQRDQAWYAATDSVQLKPPGNLDLTDQSKMRLDGTYAQWPSQGVGVGIYFLDSGVRTTHQDLGGRIGLGVDFIGDGHGIEDCLGHGTQMAGIAAGTYYGVAKRATINVVRIIDCNGRIIQSNALAGIDWIIANAARPCVANLSIEGPTDPISEAAVESLVAAGCVVAGAAGNDHGDACNFTPGSSPNAITVGNYAHYSKGKGSDYIEVLSNVGPCGDLFAPGSLVFSDWFTTDSATFYMGNGTSQSTAHVSGAAALILSEHPTYTPAQVWTRMNTDATLGVLTNAPLGTANKVLRTHNGTP